MGLGLLVGGVGARAMGGKLGLGEAPVLMGGGGRGGKPGVAEGFGAGGVGRRELDWGRRQRLTGGFLERGRRRGLWRFAGRWRTDRAF